MNDLPAGSAIRPKVRAAEDVVASRKSIRVVREDAKDRILLRHVSVGADGIVSRDCYEDMTFAIAFAGDTGVVTSAGLHPGHASLL